MKGTIILCIFKRIKSKEEKKEIRQELIYRFKEKSIIDCIYRGVCPVCGEFNTKDHLFAFEFNHLYELQKIVRKLSPNKVGHPPISFFIFLE